LNRQEATNLIQRYKDFPYTEIFGVKPYNYPLFHLLECFSKGWRVDILAPLRGGWSADLIADIHFDTLASNAKTGFRNDIWRYVARNPNVTRSVLGFVQEDLYARYVGKCNPLKTLNTTWGFTPLEAVQLDHGFRGTIGRKVPLYCLEIDLDTTDIIGERSKKLPWHYLQQTINWKPYTDRIDWNENLQP